MRVPDWSDALEILVLAVLVYWVMRLLSRTRGLPVFLGVVFLLMLTEGLERAGWEVIPGIATQILSFGTIAVLVVFQPELRYALSRIGGGVPLLGAIAPLKSRTAEEVTKAVVRLAEARHGALIAVENRDGLERWGETGERLETRVSESMLRWIFTPVSPIHDGAVIISDDSIKFVRAILPVGDSAEISGLGTRHLAAVGLSMETDATVIVVSEETGRISIARLGKLKRMAGEEEVRESLLPRAEWETTGRE